MQIPLGLTDSAMRIAVLGSGSGGNAVVVESGSKRIMVDAGFSCRELERRLGLLDIDPSTIDALVLTHEHGDHCKGASRLARRHGMAVHATEGTLEGAGLEGQQINTAVIHSGETAEIGGFEVEPFAIPHDAREPVGLVIEDPRGHRLGLVADLGTTSRLAWGRLVDLDVLILETNHDLEMLRSGPYPWPLKQRVAGRHGHLSNREASEGIPELLSDRLGWIVLYHLSRTNNLPQLAAESVGEQLVREGSDARLCVAGQLEPTDWMAVGGRAENQPEEALGS
ncbi:MAG: MBL fold metallo-hydrolase [Thermoanaerobaculia bacterium]